MTNKCTMTNKNLWSRDFKDKEMNLYDGLKERDIEIIKEYQKKLPVLQSTEENYMISGRELHRQLKVSKAFTTWIKTNLENAGMEISEDYLESWVDDNGGSFKGSLENTSVECLTGLGFKHEYLLTLDCAKEIAMITGATPRINIETKEISKLARKYFIAIEKAFKSRKTWNKNRMGSINEYYNLREVVFKDLYNENRLGDFVVGWWNIYENKTQRKNTYAYELYLLDQVVIGMSAQDYRKLHNLRKGIAIRNTFDEEQLKDFEMLQSKSAEYLVVNKMYNTEERFKTLKKFYEYYKENK